VRFLKSIVLVMTIVAAIAGVAYSQARSAPDWTTQGADAQRTSWISVDPYVSIDNMSRFQFLWKLKVDNETRHSNALTAPVALGNLMTFRGFKSLVFVGGSSNNVYAIDYDFGTLFWKTHFNYASGIPEFAGSPRCPGGMTSGVTRFASLTAPKQLSFFGFAGPPRPAKGDVGEPGKGAPQLAEIAARAAARARAAADQPRNETPARGTPPAKASTQAGSWMALGTEGIRGPNPIFAVTADGLVRVLNAHTGEIAAPPARFVIPNATVSGLIAAEGVMYAMTANNCGAAPEAVWAMDYTTDEKPVTKWVSNGASIAGFALGTDGTVYAATGTGPSAYANSVVALEAKTLRPKDWFTQPDRANGGFSSSPVIFSEGDRTYLAAAGNNGNVYLLDTASLGGADHNKPLAISSTRLQETDTTAGFSDVATWRDTRGTRWILTARRSGGGRVVAFRLAETGGTPALEHAWVSQAIISPLGPMVVNGVVFALAGGNDRGANAVLYALHPESGKEIWSSGNTITSFASAGLSAGTGQVYVVTHDNTVWSFGIPLAIN
jgi:outer membrane protein assembly factor BamB